MGDAWSLTGGLRFAYEKKEATLEIINAELGESEPSDNALLQIISFQLAGRVEGLLDDERSTENWSPMVNLQWDFSDNGMAYAKYSRGFKSGGFNARVSDSTATEKFEYDDEQVDGFEIGAKLSMLGGAATLNTALFYTEFTDRQVSTFLNDGFVVGNAAESTSKGFEIDGRLMASQHLMFGLSLAYLKSEYDEFETAGCAPEQIRPENPVAGCNGGVQDLSGETTNFAPEWSATFVTNFFYPVGDSMEFRAALDVIYSDEFYLDQSLDSNLIQDSFTKVNGRLALASNADTWEIALIGKNLTDELTHGIGAGMPFFTGSYFESVMAPRTVAVELGYRF
jgi:outer membrane receptor protein involved in Fe transport